MRLFVKRKIPYKRLVIEHLNKAMEINVKEVEVFENYAINTLEAVIAIFWMVERSLHGLPRPKLEAAGSYLMDELLVWFSDDYSREEISQFIVPAMDKRLNEYSELFGVRSDEEPQAPLMRTFKRIVENVFGEDDAHVARTLAAILLWWKPISSEGARIAALNREGKISWS